MKTATTKHRKMLKNGKTEENNSHQHDIETIPKNCKWQCSQVLFHSIQ